MKAISFFAALAFIGALTSANAQTVRAEVEAIVKDYLDNNPDQVGAIVKKYLNDNPDVLQQAIIDLMKKRGGGQPGPQAAAPDNAAKLAAIKSNANQLFNSSRQVTIGNREGDVTLVEFFDYNCGYCKRALADTLALLKDDPKLRIVLKELPILSAGSAEAARIGIALRMQDESGAKYLAYHESLMGGRGQANRDSALAAAKEAGADMERLERDVMSAEIDQTIEESRSLARAVGINGTPGYVIGEQVVPGAIGGAGLKARIAEARKKS
jgi:protein-disulfide isomerase